MEKEITITRSDAQRLLALHAAAKLESLGMKRRGRSATAIARDMIAGWGIKTPHSRAEILEFLENARADILAALDNA